MPKDAKDQRANGRAFRLLNKLFSFTPRGTTDEKVCDRVRDRKARSAFEPEEFAARVEFEKHVPPVGCEDDIDRAVVQSEVVHEAQEFLFDLDGKLIGLPVLDHA